MKRALATALAALCLCAACSRRPPEAPPAPAPPAPPPRAFDRSVVKIFVTSQNTDYFEPWKPGAQVQSEGCGTIVAGGRILTTARLVARADYIEVQRFEETAKSVARVEQVGFDTDLATLTVDDKDFFKGAQPVQFGDLPERGDKLLVQGGDKLSIREDTVAAVGMVYSEEGARELPAVITASGADHASNGCPVFRLKDGKCVGLPFDASNKPDKTGALLPGNVIERFFRATQNGQPYAGLPDLGFYTQDLENPALRSSFKMPPGQGGEIVSTVFTQGSADGVLQVGDVLTSVDGHAVDNSGYVSLDGIGRMPEMYPLFFHLVGESVDLGLLRDGKPLTAKMPLKPASRLLPYREDLRRPSYFMAGGLVFVPLTDNYFSTAEWATFKLTLQDLYFHGLPSPQRRQVVIISHVLPHMINKGYDKVKDAVVTAVNGRPITQLKDLVEAFRHPQGAFHVIQIDDYHWAGSSVVLDAGSTPRATAEILKTFEIPSDRSADLD